MIKLTLILFLVLILGFVFWFFFMRSEPTTKVKKEGPVIFLGDSLTAGVGAAPGKDFPSLIANELNIKLINAGVSGDTTVDALARLNRDVLSKNPSLVVVLLGGNDFLGRVPIDETVKNIDEIVKRISETRSAVVLVHIKSNPLNDKYKEPASDIAKKYNAVLVLDVLDGILGNPNLMADQIHPNAEGYKIMASRISPSVKKLLDE